MIDRVFGKYCPIPWLTQVFNAFAVVSNRDWRESVRTVRYLCTLNVYTQYPSCISSYWHIFTFRVRKNFLALESGDIFQIIFCLSLASSSVPFIGPRRFTRKSILFLPYTLSTKKAIKKKKERIENTHSTKNVIKKKR